MDKRVLKVSGMNVSAMRGADSAVRFCFDNREFHLVKFKDGKVGCIEVFSDNFKSLTLLEFIDLLFFIDPIPVIN